MVSTRKKKLSNRKLFGQLDDFDQDIIIGNAANCGQQDVVRNDGTTDQNFNVIIVAVFLQPMRMRLMFKLWNECSNERIDREMGNIDDTVEDKIQNASLTAIDNIVTPRIVLAVRSLYASSGRDASSITKNSECGESIEVTASFKNVSERNNTFHELNTNDETRGNIPDKLSDLSVPRTHFDWQSHTHHTISSDHLFLNFF